MLIRAVYSPQWMFAHYSGYLLSVAVVLVDSVTGSCHLLAIVDSPNAYKNMSVCYSHPQSDIKDVLTL